MTSEDVTLRGLQPDCQMLRPDPHDNNERFYRPAEVHLLTGDYSKGKKILGWEPTVSFKELIRMMVEADLKVR